MNLFARIRAHGITSEELAACLAKADGWLPPRPASDPRGGRPRNGKLTAEDVRAIRGSSGRMRIAQLAEKYGVSTATISRILADRTYLAVS